MLLFLYLISYLDKTNIGNAKIEGLLPSLHMNGEQYNVALSIFFIPYVLAGELASLAIDVLQLLIPIGRGPKQYASQQI